LEVIKARKQTIQKKLPMSKQIQKHKEHQASKSVVPNFKP